MGRGNGGIIHRPVGSFAEATTMAGDEIGYARAASLVGVKEHSFRRYANPTEMACIPCDKAVAVDLAMMTMAKDPAHRVPVHLLASAEQLGLDITYTPRNVEQVNPESPEALALDLNEMHGRLSSVIRQAGGVGYTDTDLERVKRLRSEIGSALNGIVTSMELRGAGRNVARLKVAEG